MKRSILILFLLYMRVACCGQDMLNLDEAVRIGLENNYGVLITRNESQMAKNDVTWGNAGMLPQIDINATYDKAITGVDVKTTLGTELKDNSAQTDWINAGVTLNWTLFDGLNMFIRYDKLDKLRELGEMELRKSIENTTAAIIVIYVDLVRQQMERDVLQEQVSLSQDRVRIAEAQKSVGSGSELDLLQAMVDLNSDQSALINQVASLANVKTTLNELLARDASTDFRVMDTIILGPQLVVDTLRQYTFQRNKELLLQYLQQDAALLDMKSFKAEQYPIIQFNTGYNFLKNETEASLIKYNRQLGPHFGFSADFNLFDGLNQHRKIQNAKIAMLNADLSVQQVRNQLDARLIRLYNDYQNDLQLIGFEGQNLELAIRNMDVAGESYAIGTISPIQLREVQTNLLSAKERLIYSLYKAKVKETELLLISGQLLK